MKTINRIFLFGDSFVEGQGTYSDISLNEHGIPQYNEPDLPFGDGPGTIREWRKNNSWNKFIKEITNCSVINNGIQGCNNYDQYRELNSIFNTLTENDLVLFGFTSKLRDFRSLNYSFHSDDKHNLLHHHNPLKGILGWEKISIEETNYGVVDYNINEDKFNNEDEYDFTKKFVESYFTSIYDEYPFEYIAQVNYLFYQEKFKHAGLNVIFFDLFEPYVNKEFVKPTYLVDKSIYVNYGEIHMHQWLTNYEKKYIKENELSVWEFGKTRPDLVNKIYHPNQHGYKLYIDYLFKHILSKQYNFESKII